MDEGEQLEDFFAENNARGALTNCLTVSTVSTEQMFELARNMAWFVCCDQLTVVSIPQKA